MRDITEKEFKDAIKEGFTLVDVYGNNCAPCVMLEQVLTLLEKEYPFVDIVRINSDDNPAFCEEQVIQGVPTLLFAKDGEVKDRRVGAIPVDQIMEVAGEYLY